MIWPDRYLAMARFTAVARPMTAIGAIIAVTVLFETAFAIMNAWIYTQPIDRSATPLGSVIELAAFGGVAIVLIAAVRLIHRRTFASLRGSPMARPFWTAAVAVAVVLMLQEPILLAMDPADKLAVRQVASWLAWLVPGLAAILIQVGTEELFYRGYLQQQLGAVSARPLVWMVLPSIYFGFGHLFNGETMAEGILWAIWATGFGLACADLTARTGSIGAAVGLHFVNNIFATVIVGTAGQPLSGLALLLYPPIDGPVIDDGAVALLTPHTLQDLILSGLSILVMWLAVRVAIRR